MKIDELFLVGGSDIKVGDITLRQPRLDDLRNPEVGFAKYNSYVRLLSMNIEDIVGVDQYLSIPEETRAQFTAFNALVVTPDLCYLLLEALKFFVREDLKLDYKVAGFVTESGGIINNDTYDEIRNVILQFCGMEVANIGTPKFKGKKSKKIFEKIMKGRAEAAKAKKGSNDESYSLPNIISKISAKHPSLNLLNIWDLTVWQLYDQFSCVSVNDQLNVVGLRWAAWGKDPFDFTAWLKKNNKK